MRAPLLRTCSFPFSESASQLQQHRQNIVALRFMLTWRSGVAGSLRIHAEGCGWSSNDGAYLFQGALGALLLGLGFPHLIVALTCARSLQPDPKDLESMPLTAGQDSVAVTVPAGAVGGSTIQVLVNGQSMMVTVPEGLSAGQQFLVSPPAPLTAVAVATVAAPAPQNMSVELP